MSDVVIRAENLAKKYVIGRNREHHRYVALRDVIVHNIHSMWKKTTHMLSGNATVDSNTFEEIWALRDINFEVREGEVVGIIGRNGAGKSTLLKILSRITEPTSGRISIKGRIASLLEVGTGFHPELTGRENIFLNGSVLGMSRTEIRRKFDEIVAFAEIDKFLDTPVKRYSSGMYVRLAFAVAAHLEPEILIIDEVLAVGDARFQKKCLGRMSKVAKDGRTVLLVSHNAAVIASLCSSALLLDGGKTARAGAPADVLASYLAHQQEDASSPNESFQRLNAVASVSELSVSPSVVTSGDAARIQLRIDLIEDEVVSELALLVYNPNGVRVAIIDMRSSQGPRILHKGSTTFNVDLHSIDFVEGEYDLGLYYRSMRSAGDYYNLGRIVIAPRISRGGLIPFAPQYRGVVELSHKVSVSDPVEIRGQTGEFPIFELQNREFTRLTPNLIK